MRALVTGGAGFIGSHLVDRLLADGAEVVVIDSFVTGSRENLRSAAAAAPDRLTVVDADISRPETGDVIAGSRADVVFHLAAQMDVRRSVREPAYDATVNVVGTVNVLEGARRAQVDKVVFTSSGGCIYGPPDAEPIGEDFPTRPHSPYGASKLCGEAYLEMFHRLYGMAFTTLALGNVYGPRQDPLGEAGVVAIFAGRMLDGAPTVIFGDGGTSRDYVYVDDVVDALLRAVTGGNRRYNIGSARATTVSDLHTLLSVIIGSTRPPLMEPPRAAELQAITLDPSAAADDMGWYPAITLEEGLARTVAALRDDRPGAPPTTP